MTTRDEQARAHLERGTEALKALPTQIDARRRAKMLENIEAARAERPAAWFRGARWALGGAVVAAAATAVVVLWVPEAPDRATFTPSPAIAFSEGAEVVGTEQPRLETGRATLVMPEVPPPKAPVRLDTPHARIELAVGEATVVVLDGVTTLEVIAGRAMWIVAGQRSVVEAGERVQWPAPSASRAVPSGDDGTDEPDRASMAAAGKQSGVENARERRPRADRDRASMEDAVKRDSAATADTPRAEEDRATATAADLDATAAAPKPATDDAPGGAPRTLAAAPKAPPTDAETREQEKQVETARELMRRDAAKAERIASEVLEQKPEPKVEAGALMVVADARRRATDHAVAARLYARVADLPEGRELHEEALFRRAELLRQTGDVDEALAALERASHLPARALAPERAALELGLIETKSGAARAATRALTYSRLGGAAMARARLDLAKALHETNPVTALVLLDAIRRHGGTRATLLEAEALRKKIDDR